MFPKSLRVFIPEPLEYAVPLLGPEAGIKQAAGVLPGAAGRLTFYSRTRGCCNPASQSRVPAIKLQ
jgi:hypothetical protein